MSVDGVEWMRWAQYRYQCRAGDGDDTTSDIKGGKLRECTNKRVSE